MHSRLEAMRNAQVSTGCSVEMDKDGMVSDNLKLKKSIKLVMMTKEI